MSNKDNVVSLSLVRACTLAVAVSSLRSPVQHNADAHAHSIWTHALLIKSRGSHAIGEALHSHAQVSAE